MKRCLIAILVFVLVTAGTAFAGPFADVPANHWSYDAVSKLAKAGIIEGYGDNSFGGDKVMTRYEMAQIVAKAIEHSDKADAASKAAIDKLSAEYATELTSLGVRVTKLEAKTKVNIFGDIRTRYAWDSPTANFQSKALNGYEKFRGRIQLYATAPINDKIDTLIRFESGYKYAGTSANSGTGAPNLAAPSIHWGWVAAKNTAGFDLIRVGRQPVDGVGYAAFFGADPGNDGIYLVKNLSKVMTWKGGMYNTNGSGNGDGNKTGRVSGTALWFKPDKQLEYNIGYWWSNEAGSNSTMMVDSGRTYNSNQGLDIGMYKDFGPRLHLISEATFTHLNDAANLPSNPKAFMFQLHTGTYKPALFYSAFNIVNAKTQKPGTDAWGLSYRSISAGATAASQQPILFTNSSNNFGSGYNVSSLCDNVNVWMLLYQRVVEKNVMLTLEYQNFKVKDTSLITNGEANKNLEKAYKVQFDFYF